MKSLILKSAVALCAIVGLSSCSDDSSSSPAPNTNSSTLNVVVTAPAWLFDNGSTILVIYPNGTVTDAQGNNYGTFDGSNIVDANGSVVVQNVDTNTLPIQQPNATKDTTTGEIIVLSSSSAEVIQELDITSSATVDAPTIKSSSSVSQSVTPEISSSSIEIKPVSGEFPSIESYGPPPAEYTKDISNNGTKGWNSRYWDACKPHCSWISNGEEGKTDTTTQESYLKGMTTTRNCNIHDIEVPTFTLGHAVQQYWMGYEGTNSACGDAKEKGVFTCTDMAPIAVNENLSYAYVAGPGSATTCGKCFHLQYDGGFKDLSANNKAKATHKALKGKHIVVMTSNIGHDVANGQFDLMVPGGGVGAFDALSVQVNGANVNWGAGFGGFLTECQSKLGYDNTLENYQTCVKDMCDAAFGNAGLPNLLRGCHWFADWYMAADNPTYQWEEVECPKYLLDHYLTTINTTKDNRYKWHDDWSTYKGEPLDTLECLTADYPQGCKTN